MKPSRLPNHAPQSSSVLGLNRLQSSMNSGRWPSSSDSRLRNTLIICRVRSTIGSRMVVPGRLEIWRFQMK